jgi:hypothetical protein
LNLLQSFCGLCRRIDVVRVRRSNHALNNGWECRAGLLPWIPTNEKKRELPLIPNHMATQTAPTYQQ